VAGLVDHSVCAFAHLFEDFVFFVDMII
jgi:hypothetical protein